LLVGIGAVVCVAPETAQEPASCDRGQLAEKRLDERLAVWQRRLKLEDWNVTIVMSHPSELRKGTLGNIHWDADNKTAVVRVLDASDYETPWNDTLKDMEFTVVHELIHLELASLPRNDASRTHEEHAVNNMADALLDLDRLDQRPLDSRALIQPDLYAR
jgi:hypothetical protein